MWGWIALVLIIVSLIYLVPRISFAMKWSVYTKSIASYKTLTQYGKTHNEALNYMVNWLRYREPFNQLTDADANRIYETVKTISNPIHVTALILQNCEWSNENVEFLKKQETLTQWVITEDVKYSLQMLFNNVRKLLDVNKLNPNYKVIDSLADAINNRIGWTLNGEDFYFYERKYKPSKENSSFEYAKMVIIAEMDYQLSMFQSGTNDLTDYLVRKSILKNIDDFVREALKEIAK